MSFSSGLTSLRESPLPSLLPTPLSPSETDGRRLAEVRAEIQRFYKLRDELREEVKRLQQQIAKSKDIAKSDTEVKRLKIQKSILIAQVRELFLLLERLTGKKSDLLSSLDTYGKERTGDLVVLSKQISVELGYVNEDLSRKSDKLNAEETLLGEIAGYYMKWAEICEATASCNARERLTLDKRYQDTTRREKDIAMSIKKAQNMIKRAERLQHEADGRLESMDIVSRWFEDEADKEKNVLERRMEEVSFREKRVSAEKRELAVERKRLFELLRLIKDKDDALNRKARELKLVI